MFYSNEQQLIDHLSRFIAAALNAGNGAIVVATREHQQNLVRSLEAGGIDLAAALRQGRYIALDAADTLASCMVDGIFDSVQFLQSFENLILKISSAVQGKRPRVAFFGECVDLLWKQGDAKAAIQAEKIGNQLSRRHIVDILCAYSRGVQGAMEEDVLQRICAEHSAVYYK